MSRGCLQARLYTVTDDAPSRTHVKIINVSDFDCSHIKWKGLRGSSGGRRLLKSDNGKSIGMATIRRYSEPQHHVPIYLHGVDGEMAKRILRRALDSCMWRFWEVIPNIKSEVSPAKCDAS